MKQHRYYIFNQGRLLIPSTNNINDIRIVDGQLPIATTPLHLFKESVNTNCYVGSSDHEELGERYRWVGLRESYYVLPPEIYQQAGKASELLHFDTHNTYCGLCGGPMHWNTAISKLCPQCGREIWPQLSPAIIVLIHKGDEALLVKAKSFKRNFYGLVAGFVETGESLEECVLREVREETGLEINNIRYFGSQPWPYPMGLMIGFHADYVGGDIALVDGELFDAAFFKRDNLPPIPEKLSMARMLIDSWLESGNDQAE